MNRASRDPATWVDTVDPSTNSSRTVAEFEAALRKYQTAYASRY